MASSNNFEIEKFDNGNAYMISGIQVQSGAPTNKQTLVYSSTLNQWTFAPPVAGIPIQAGTPSNGQTLKYDSTSNQWLFAT